MSFSFHSVGGSTEHNAATPRSINKHDISRHLCRRIAICDGRNRIFLHSLEISLVFVTYLTSCIDINSAEMLPRRAPVLSQTPIFNTTLTNNFANRECLKLMFHCNCLPRLMISGKMVLKKPSQSYSTIDV